MCKKIRPVKVSLRKIAEECGISYQTVSRIMNGEGYKHKQSTIDLVESTANGLGYRRNLLARGMMTGKSLTIGVILPYHVGREFNATIMEGIQTELEKNDYAAINISVHGNDEDIKRAHRLIERRVDGVIYRSHPHGESDKFIEELKRHGIPLVSVVENDHTLSKNIDFIGVDEKFLGTQAAEYLLNKGHKIIGFTRIGNARFDAPLKERFESFKKRVEEKGGKIVHTPKSNSSEMSVAEIKKMLSRKKRPTAVFCSVDDIAYKTYEIALKLGLRIPDDLSIMGSSDYYASQYFNPSLTTFNLNAEEIGRRSADQLIRRIQSENLDHTATITVRSQLKDRNSVSEIS